MVLTRNDMAWMRRGFSLLWNASLLMKICNHDDVVSLRNFLSMSNNWPEELPSQNGNALVVTGIEGCLDILNHNDAEDWIESDLKEAILSFQEYYQGSASLIFWMPSGLTKIDMARATEEYFWKQGSEKKIHIGRLLWSGAEKEVERIIDGTERNQDIDGKAWSGLHHPRIS